MVAGDLLLAGDAAEHPLDHASRYVLNTDQRFPLATFSISSFLRIAKLFWESPFSVLMISSAKHSAMVFIERKACSRVPSLTVGGTVGNKINSLIDSTDGRNIDGLLTDDTSSTNTGAVFTGTGLNDSLHQHIKRVPAGEQGDDFEGVTHDTDGLDLLTGVASVELQAADEPLNNWAGGLAEGLLLVTTGSVGHEHLRLVALDSDVINEALVSDLHSVVRPLAEQLGRGLEGLLLVLLGNFSHVVRNN
jgi:hypothetical protein